MKNTIHVVEMKSGQLRLRDTLCIFRGRGEGAIITIPWKGMKRIVIGKWLKGTNTYNVQSIEKAL